MPREPQTLMVYLSMQVMKPLVTQTIQMTMKLKLKTRVTKAMERKATETNLKRKRRKMLIRETPTK